MRTFFRMPSINMTETGRNIENLRRGRGISVRQLQEIFGFATPQAIYKWQHGDTLPTVDNLLVLAEIFQTPIEKILVVEEKE